MARSRNVAAKTKKKNLVWVVFAVIVGLLIVGGLLGRAGIPAVAIGVLAAAALGIFTLIKGATPVVGMRSRKSGFGALGAALLLLVGGAAGAAPATTNDAPAALMQADSAAPSIKPQTEKRAPTPTPTPTTFEEVDVDTAIPFERTLADDPNTAEGTTAITTAGVNGTLRTTYRVTYVGGTEVSREVVRESVAVAPVTEVTTRGTLKPQPVTKPVPLVQTGGNGCDPNYSGACVPVASDVDCAGGSGNGPAYLSGSARVVGSDIYDLDRDANGIACD